METKKELMNLEEGEQRCDHCGLPIKDLPCEFCGNGLPEGVDEGMTYTIEESLAEEEDE